MTQPLTFPPSPFNQQDAIHCGDLVETAYDMYSQWKKLGKPNQADFNQKWSPQKPSWSSQVNLKFSQPIWGTDKVLDSRDPEPFAVIAWGDNGVTYLAIRGTESGADWFKNIEFCKTDYSFAPNYGRVEDGFQSIYSTMHESIIQTLKAIQNSQLLYITGHSLGSSLSTLSVPDILENTNFTSSNVVQYNFASPKVGDSNFKSAYDNNGVVTYRFVNQVDLVPKVPDSFEDPYEHINQEVSFSANYWNVANNHNMSCSYMYALNHPDNPKNPNMEACVQES